MKRPLLLACALLCAACLAVRVASAADAKAGTTKPLPRPASGAKSAGVDSLAILEKAVARDSTNWENLYRIGLMYLDRDRPEQAQTVFLKATRVRPDHVPTLVNLGAAYDANGRGADAQVTYREALKLAPSDSVAACRLASSLYAVGNYGESVKLLRGLIESSPRAYCAYFTLGVAFADAGIYRDAIRMWKKVIELAPDSAEGLSAKESIDVLERVIQAKAQ